MCIALVILDTVNAHNICCILGQAAAKATPLSIDLIVNRRLFGALFALFFDCGDGHCCDLVKYLEVLGGEWSLLILAFATTHVIL